jgi:ADP-ribose pyrophosphatase YjhB (NUDIX family)
MADGLKNAIKYASADCVIFGFEDFSLKILIYKRAKGPSKGAWALPGGFLKKKELFEEAARRILKETTGVTNIYLEEIAVFDQIDRFPLWRVFTVAFFALIKPSKYQLIDSGLNSSEAKWVKVSELPELAWDHEHIVEVALDKLRHSILQRPIGVELMPSKFTLPQLRSLYEAILDKPLDRRNFHRKIIKMNLVEKLNEKDAKNRRRAAYLYKFNESVSKSSGII